MNIYVMTDSHLGHEKLVHMGQGRPEDFSEQVLRGLTKVSGDLLIHLGDVCIGDDSKWNGELLACANFKTRVLVRGNHDNKSDHFYYARGWDFVAHEFSAKYFGKRIHFSHAPVPAVFDWRVDVNIHGHTHGNGLNGHRGEDWYDDMFNIDAAPELHGYTPVNLEKLLCN